MSSERAPVPDHKHCLVCSKPISLNQQTCSPECQQAFTRQLKSQRRTSWIFIGILVVAMLVWLFLAGRTGK